MSLTFRRLFCTTVHVVFCGRRWCRRWTRTPRLGRAQRGPCLGSGGWGAYRARGLVQARCARHLHLPATHTHTPTPTLPPPPPPPPPRTPHPPATPTPPRPFWHSILGFPWPTCIELAASTSCVSSPTPIQHPSRKLWHPVDGSARYPSDAKPLSSGPLAPMFVCVFAA
jgi:hypothetical protein